MIVQMMKDEVYLYTQRPEGMTRADQDPFLFSVLPEKRNGSSALPQMPLAGLFHDGPPRARLRSGQAAFLCHRQRRLVRPKRKGRPRAERGQKTEAGHRDRPTLYRTGTRVYTGSRYRPRKASLTLAALPWEKVQGSNWSCTMYVGRDALLKPCTKVQRAGALFFLPPGAALSFFSARRKER